MPELPPPQELAALITVIFLAGMTNGTTGMGFALLAAAGLALVVDLTKAVVLLSVMVPPTSAMQLLRHRSDVEDSRKALPLLTTALIGVVLGIYLLKTLPSRYLVFVLGLFTVLFVLSSLRKYKLVLTPQQERW